MKKLLFPLAILAAVLISCDKSDDPGKSAEPEYEKTIVSLAGNLSEDYLAFFDVKLTGTDFEGNAVDVTVTDSTSSYSWSTTLKQAEMTLRAYATLKEQYAAIDTTRKYVMTKNMNGEIKAKVKGKDEYMSFQTFNFTTLGVSFTFKGINLYNNANVILPALVFDKTMKFTVAPSDDAVTVSANTVNVPE